MRQDKLKEDESSRHLRVNIFISQVPARHLPWLRRAFRYANRKCARSIELLLLCNLMCGRFWALVGTRLSFAFSSPPVVISLLTSSFSPSKYPHLSLSLSLSLFYTPIKSIQSLSQFSVIMTNAFSVKDPVRCRHYARFMSHLTLTEANLVFWLLFIVVSPLSCTTTTDPFILLEEKIELQFLLMLSSRLTPH